jgi:hypothetical protein
MPLTPNASHSKPLEATGRQDNPWWYAILLIVGGGGIGIWVLIAVLSPQDWTVPAYEQTLSAGGEFNAHNVIQTRPYGFRRADGGYLNLSCYPERSNNDCINAFAGLTGMPVTIRYFVVHPYDPLLQWTLGSGSNIVVEVDGPQGTGLTFQQSVDRLRKWSLKEPSQDRAIALPIGLFVSIFLTLIGVFRAYIIIHKISRERGADV